MIVGRYYTAEQVGHILGLKAHTIRLWTNQGKIPFAMNFGSDKRPRWHYPIDEFEEWEKQIRKEWRIVPKEEDGGTSTDRMLSLA